MSKAKLPVTIYIAGDLTADGLQEAHLPVIQYLKPDPAAYSQ
jgi:hypothetical protein